MEYQGTPRVRRRGEVGPDCANRTSIFYWESIKSLQTKFRISTHIQINDKWAGGASP